MQIGFFGTGLMGAPMAVQLIEAGHELFLYNRTRSKAEIVALIGGTVYEKPMKVIEKSNVVITMLSDITAIKNIFISKEEKSFTGRTFIQMSTIAPDESLEMKKFVESNGGEYFEAPILGSIPQAKSASLIMLVGSTEEQFKKWSSFFRPFGKEIVYVGKVGEAAATKLALNQLIASLTTTFSMSYGYLREKGIDTKPFMDILRRSALYAPTFDKKLDKMANRDFGNPNFPLKHLLKDVNLIKNDFEKYNIETAPLKGVQKILLKAIDQNLSELDYSALYNAIHPKKK